MGMFDTVDLKGNRIICPHCMNEAKPKLGFQTKDGPMVLSYIDYREVGTFYGECTNCDSWLEITWKPDYQYKDIPEDVWANSVIDNKCCESCGRYIRDITQYQIQCRTRLPRGTTYLVGVKEVEEEWRDKNGI